MIRCLVLGVVVLSIVFQDTMARCKGDWDPCSDQSECCPGFTCTTWASSQSRCKRDGDKRCESRGEGCGLFSWCCEGLTCVQKNRKYVCSD